MNAREYQRSNRVLGYSFGFDTPTLDSLRTLLPAASAEQRQLLGAELLGALCALAGTATPRLIVIDEPRPHRVRDGRTVYQRYGSYSPRTQTIRLHNRTARLGRSVARGVFLETLLHELMHHWDFELLGLRKSLHTSGFYHRLGTLKRGLLAAAFPPAAAS